ncbi:hypothetical protein UFOVP587_10 [uncultured Caudovirales phage]|uniref:Uncharacterized protein n=1 Tax=uncultured Caudovirales phage TaxID=2100421 RepID=A0A6J5MZB8_9CAUD|nr:hypothetical protein UFOVP587_10 [uncultured Caudovirales phage]
MPPKSPSPSKKAATKKPVAKKPVAKKPTVKKPTAQELKRAYNKNLVANRPKPAKPQSAGAKIKVAPYDAKWKADVAKQNKAYNKSFVNKYVRPLSETIGPMALIKYAAEAATGRDLSAPAGSKKKINRAGALGNVAFYALPVGSAFKGAKALKKAKDAKKVYSATSKFIKDNKINKATTVKVYNAKKRQMGN